MNFSDFSLHPRIAANIRALNFSTPTPIQARTIPPIMEGRDVLGLAQTGTGKTAAFGLPILHRLSSGKRGRVRALVIAPTRELAEQIHEAIGAMGGGIGLKSLTVYGGVSINPQIARLRRGADIVVACPGRLLDHINQRTIDLSALEVLVLDEADHMFDMGFLPNIRRILAKLPRTRQTLLFSATMPTDIRRLAEEILNDPVTVQIAHTAPAETVAHCLYPVAQHLKTPLLKALLAHTDTESVLVFTRTKHRAKRIGQQLEQAGHRAASLQGNLSQNKRQAALDGFRNGRHQILVATDIAARGIDVTQVSHVINYDMPDTVEAYTHRIGRTGRATRNGDAFTFVTREDKDLVRVLERRLNASLERRQLEGFDYNAAAPAREAEPARPRRTSRPAAGAAAPAAAGKRRGASPPRPGARRNEGQGRKPRAQARSGRGSYNQR